MYSLVTSTRAPVDPRVWNSITLINYLFLSSELFYSTKSPEGNNIYFALITKDTKNKDEVQSQNNYIYNLELTNNVTQQNNIQSYKFHE